MEPSNVESKPKIIQTRVEIKKERSDRNRPAKNMYSSRSSIAHSPLSFGSAYLPPIEPNLRTAPSMLTAIPRPMMGRN